MGSQPWVRLHTLDGSYVDLRSVEAAGVHELIDAMANEDPVLSFDLDDGRSQVYVPRESLARVDVDWEISWWRRFKSALLVRLDRWR